MGTDGRADADNNGLMDAASDLLETIASLDGVNYIDEHVDEDEPEEMAWALRVLIAMNLSLVGFWYPTRRRTAR